MPSDSSLQTYDHMLKESFQTVGHAVGIHVLLLVIERAVWSTCSKYEEWSLITYSEEGVSLQGLSVLDPDRATAIAHHLVITIIATLGKLVGKQLAQRLLEQMELDNQEV